jgi:hypothetical protein
MSVWECQSCLELIAAYDDAVSAWEDAQDQTEIEQAKARVIEARRILADHLQDRAIHGDLHVRQIMQRRLYLPP